MISLSCAVGHVLIFILKSQYKGVNQGTVELAHVHNVYSLLMRKSCKVVPIRKPEKVCSPSLSKSAIKPQAVLDRMCKLPVCEKKEAVGFIPMFPPNGNLVIFFAIYRLSDLLHVMTSRGPGRSANCGKKTILFRNLENTLGKISQIKRSGLYFLQICPNS